MSSKLFRRMAFVTAFLFGVVVAFYPHFLGIESVLWGIVGTIIMYLLILKLCRPLLK